MTITMTMTTETAPERGSRPAGGRSEAGGAQGARGVSARFGAERSLARRVGWCGLFVVMVGCGGTGAVPGPAVGGPACGGAPPCTNPQNECVERTGPCDEDICKEFGMTCAVPEGVTTLRCLMRCENDKECHEKGMTGTVCRGVNPLKYCQMPPS